MNQTYIRQLFHPKLENPILVVGLPGIGNVGRIVAKMLVDSSQAKIFAELYSPVFPDYVVIDRKGVCRPPRYEFYVSTVGRDLLLLTGDSQPPLEDVPAHYEVCDDVLDFVGKLGCRYVITVEGAPSPHPTKEVFVAATSKKHAEEIAKKDARIYKGRSIVGMSGLLLGLAKRHRFEGFCLLGSTLGLTADRETAAKVYRFLRKYLGMEIQERL